MIRIRENGFLKLRIAGQDLDLEEITERLSKKPSFVCRKGEQAVSKHGKKPAFYKEDCWILEAEKEENETFDAAMNRFLAEFESSADYVKELSDKCDVTLWISVYPDDEQSNIHLSHEILHRASDMGISIDLNVLFLKAFYDGAYCD